MKSLFIIASNMITYAANGSAVNVVPAVNNSDYTVTVQSLPYLVGD